MKLIRLILAFTLLAPASGLMARDSEAPEFPDVREAVKHAHQAEQQAFIKGDCEKVVSYFDDRVLMYANGRHIPSLEVLQGFCSRIPRPFEGNGEITDEVRALSADSAFTVRKIEFPPESKAAETRKREVITKIWKKTAAGWKILHFHSSINEVPNR